MFELPDGVAGFGVGAKPTTRNDGSSCRVCGLWEVSMSQLRETPLLPLEEFFVDCFMPVNAFASFLNNAFAVCGRLHKQWWTNLELLWISDELFDGD